MVLTAGLGFQAQPARPAAGQTSGGSRLEVRPARRSPSSSINQLQGAGGLQSQSDGGLLPTPAGQRLQPNARTDGLNGTRTVQ